MFGRYFEVVGEWDKVFNSFERFIVIEVGSLAMWLLGKKLKRKSVFVLSLNTVFFLNDHCVQCVVLLMLKAVSA